MCPDQLKIATFNVNSIRSRLPIVLDWLAACEPDVLCLQETKVEDKDFPAEPFRDAGYHATFFGQKRWNGVAFISREPFQNVSRGLEVGGPPDEARIIRGTYAGVSILNTYVPQGRDVNTEQFAYKLKWFQALAALLKAEYSPADPLVWCGDLNHIPDGMDVYDPEAKLGHVCYHPEVDRVFRAIVEWGFVDLFRKHCPDAGHYSFWDYRIPNAVKRGLGWRLDQVMATEALAGTCVSCLIDKDPRMKEKPSDHTPVLATFCLGGSLPGGG